MIQSSLLLQFPELTHGFSTAADVPVGGNMSLNRGPREEVLANRRRFCERLGLDPQSLVMADQVHSARVFCIAGEDRGKGAQELISPLGCGDALCTGERDLPLSVLVADCAAVFLYDPVRPAIGVAHSGWRGTAEAVAPALIDTMRRRYDVRPADLRGWISPCIGPESFEVGSEVIDLFRRQQPRVTRQPGWWHTAGEKNGQRWLLDLKEVIRRQLHDSGVPEPQIDVSIDCTFRQERYFSYRRAGGNAGHMMAVLALKGAPGGQG